MPAQHTISANRQSQLPHVSPGADIAPGLPSHGNLYLFVESIGVGMFRYAILSLLILSPTALAQETEEEGRKLADSLTQTDVDTLGVCQARVEGMGMLVDEFQGWMQQQGYTEQLAGIRDAREKGAGLIATFAELRGLLGSEDGGFDLNASETALKRMLETFRRQPGEATHDAYNRWHTETRLPPACFEAMKRARWRVELENLYEDE
jgi:hypothetical protein